MKLKFNKQDIKNILNSKDSFDLLGEVSAEIEGSTANEAVFLSNLENKAYARGYETGYRAGYYERKNKLTSSFLKNENIGIKEKIDKYQDRLKSGVNDYVYPRNYQKFNNRTTGLHPTQKPVELFAYLIRTYTNKNDLVLDNCLGSGTTAVACTKTGRRFIGIEISKDYCEIAEQRLEQQILNF